MNALDVRPKKDFAIVLMEPRKEVLSSGLHLPTEETGVEKVTDGCGKIISLGGGDLVKATGVKEGDRVCFRAYLKHAIPLHTDEVWEDGRKKEYFFLSVKDIMAVVPEGMEVGCFSKRSMT